MLWGHLLSQIFIWIMKNRPLKVTMVPSSSFGSVTGTTSLLHCCELTPFFQHINSVDSNIKFTQEFCKDRKLSFFDCLVTINTNGSLLTDLCLYCESHRPLIHKLAVIHTLTLLSAIQKKSTEKRKTSMQHLRNVALFQQGVY